MGMGVGEQVRKIELDAYQAFMKVTAVTGMSWVRPATPDPLLLVRARPAFYFSHVFFSRPPLLSFPPVLPGPPLILSTPLAPRSSPRSVTSSPPSSARS